MTLVTLSDNHIVGRDGPMSGAVIGLGHDEDLCHLVGHPTSNEQDPSGKRFGFEMGVAKTSGGQGWADVAKLGYFGWEYEGEDANLETALLLTS